MKEFNQLREDNDSIIDKYQAVLDKRVNERV